MNVVKLHLQRVLTNLINHLNTSKTMKYLKFPQPYATALCYGYYNGIHLEEAPKFCSEVYAVIATEPVFDPETPIELLMQIHNEQLFGNLPLTEDLPVNQVIGFFTATDDEPYETDVWTQSLPKPVYSVLSPGLFDVPFPCNHLREDLDLTKMIPSHRILGRQEPSSHLSLYLDVNEKAFYVAAAGGSILVDLTDEVRKVILKDPENEDDLKEFKRVCLVCKNRIKSFDVMKPLEIIYELDAKGDPVLYPSIEPGKRLMRVSLKIDFGLLIE